MNRVTEGMVVLQTQVVHLQCFSFRVSCILFHHIICFSHQGNEQVIVLHLTRLPSISSSPHCSCCLLVWYIYVTCNRFRRYSMTEADLGQLATEPLLGTPYSDTLKVSKVLPYHTLHKVYFETFILYTNHRR